MAGLLVIGIELPMVGAPMYLWGWFLVSAFSALTLLQVMVAPDSGITRFLGNPVLAFFGKISYGLYVWHYPIVKVIEDQKWPWWKNALVGVPAVTLVTLASYYLLEQPCLRLKRRFRGTPAKGSSIH